MHSSLVHASAPQRDEIGGSIRFTSVVEQATGRKIRVFLPETSIEQDVSVETFLLREDPPDMTGVEKA